MRRAKRQKSGARTVPKFGENRRERLRLRKDKVRGGGDVINRCVRHSIRRSASVTDQRDNVPVIGMDMQLPEVPGLYFETWFISELMIEAFAPEIEACVQVLIPDGVIGGLGGQCRWQLRPRAGVGARFRAGPPARGRAPSGSGQGPRSG